jgi:shikimate dehydrogenase
MVQIGGSTQLLGVIGYPIAHTLSPAMHNAAIAHLGVDFAYLPFAIAPADLATAIAGFGALGVRGFSVTIPHKQTIMPLLTQISPDAQAVGAVNTVCRTPEGWLGTNTDVLGFMAPLQGRSPVGLTEQALVLGTGGAARAVVAGCHQLGYGRIRVVGRSGAKCQDFLTSWQSHPAAPALSVHGWDALPTLLPQSTLVVNATPVGMHPQADQSPLSRAHLQQLPPGAIVYDLIYTPNPTRLLAEAQDLGAIALDGLEMLAQQGAAALALWLEQPAPVDVMRQTLRDALGLSH